MGIWYLLNLYTWPSSHISKLYFQLGFFFWENEEQHLFSFNQLWIMILRLKYWPTFKCCRDRWVKVGIIGNIFWVIAQPPILGLILEYFGGYLLGIERQFQDLSLNKDPLIQHSLTFSPQKQRLRNFFTTKTKIKKLFHHINKD